MNQRTFSEDDLRLVRENLKEKDRSVKWLMIDLSIKWFFQKKPAAQKRCKPVTFRRYKSLLLVGVRQYPKKPANELALGYFHPLVKGVVFFESIIPYTGNIDNASGVVRRSTHSDKEFVVEPFRPFADLSKWYYMARHSIVLMPSYKDYHGNEVFKGSSGLAITHLHFEDGNRFGIRASKWKSLLAFLNQWLPPLPSPSPHQSGK